MTNKCKIPCIVIEGTDGSGKSTVVELLKNKLNEREIPTKAIRLIGSSDYAELVRKHLVSGDLVKHLSANTVNYLIASTFFETIDKVIKPANDKGIGVICDRFADSMHVYQQGVNTTELVNQIKDYYPPTITFLLDVPPQVALTRLNTRNEKDSMDTSSLALAGMRRQQYLDIYHQHGKAIPVGEMYLIDANQTAEQIVATMLTYLENYL